MVYVTTINQPTFRRAPSWKTCCHKNLVFFILIDNLGIYFLFLNFSWRIHVQTDCTCYTLHLVSSGIWITDDMFCHSADKVDNVSSSFYHCFGSSCLQWFCCLKLDFSCNFSSCSFQHHNAWLAGLFQQ